MNEEHLKSILRRKVIELDPATTVGELYSIATQLTKPIEIKVVGEKISLYIEEDI